MFMGCKVFMKKKITAIIILSCLFDSLFLIAIYFLREFYFAELLISFLPQIALFSVLFSVVSIYLLIRENLTIGKVFLSAVLLAVPIFFMFRVVNFYNYEKIENSNEREISILSSNLLAWNKNHDAMKKMISEKNPDVMILVELTDKQRDGIDDVLKDYPYMRDVQISIGYTTIYSKYEISDSDVVDSEGIGRSIVKAQIQKDNKKYLVYAIHTTAPTNPEYFELRNEFMKTLAKDMDKEKDSELIVAGDFNLSPWSKYYEDFETDIGSFAFDASTSGGLITTWGPLPGIPVSSHIDHIFISKNLKVKKFQAVNLNGSDHESLYLELNHS